MGICWVQKELYKRVRSEKGRNHLDMRHRLDKDGNRYGSVLDYRSSELRVDELLSDLCVPLEKYLLNSQGEWRAHAQKEPTAGDQARRKEQGRQLRHYCERLIESGEDRLAVALRGSPEELTKLGVSDLLCSTLTDACNRAQPEKTEL